MRRALFVIPIVLIFLMPGCGPRDRRITLEKIGSGENPKSVEQPAEHSANPMGAQIRDTSLSPGDFDKPKGGYTVAECYELRDKLQGKKVQVRGRVVKVNPGIMGKNWIHIQDGTGGDDFFDLTVTADTEPEVGQTVLVKGKLFKDRDVGIEIIYPVLIEDAVITIE